MRLTKCRNKSVALKATIYLLQAKFGWREYAPPSKPPPLGKKEQAQRAAEGRGDDALAVGAERRAHHTFRMAFERLADRLAGLGVPQPRRLVRRRGDDALAVGAERRALTLSVMACERLADRLAGLGVPQPRRLVRRRGDDALAVGAERRANHSTLMAVENEPLAQIAPGAIELQLRLWDIGPSNPGRAIGQRLEREQDCSRPIARLTVLARQIPQEERLRGLRLLELSLGLVPFLLRDYRGGIGLLPLQLGFVAGLTGCPPKPPGSARDDEQEDRGSDCTSDLCATAGSELSGAA